MANIRPYREKDRERVRHICLRNAECLEASQETKDYILLMYCDYYIDQEPDNCFVAVDKDDNAIGYIICSEDYDAYEKVFREIYLPKAMQISIKRYIDAKLDLMSHSMFKNRYPSHLHIDIYEEYQRMGIGSELIKTLCKNLKLKGKDGVMLVCGSDNEQAKNFYIKNGFKPLLNTKVGSALALDF